MITVSQESWVALAAIGAFAIALFGYLRNISKDLKAEIGKVDDKVDKTRTELVSAIAATRTELKGDIATLDDTIQNTRTELKGDIATLDDKVDKTRTELFSAIGATRTELKGDIASLDDTIQKTRTELVSALTGGFAKVEARLIALEQRTYDISTRLPAAPASTSTP